MKNLTTNETIESVTGLNRRHAFIDIKLSTFSLANPPVKTGANQVQSKILPLCSCLLLLGISEPGCSKFV